MNKTLKFILISIASIAILLLAIQLIPVQRQNPPVVTQIQWDSPQTQALFMRACGDCHSNETTWPWYSYVAPASWLISHNVSEGRRRFNVSELNTSSNRLGRLTSEFERAISGNRMPPAQFTVIHPDARLTSDEKQALIAGLKATFTNPQIQ